MMEITLNYTKWATNKRRIDGDTRDRCADESCDARRKITKTLLPHVALTLLPGRHDNSNPLIWIASDNTSTTS